MLRYKTEIAWFSRLVRHPARRRSGSILTTPEPARGLCWATDRLTTAAGYVFNGVLL